MKVIPNEKIKVCQDIHEKARYLRGRFLNTIAVIEHELSIILTEYFCRDDERKIELFSSQIIRRMSLEKKLNLLKSIVKQDYPQYYESNKNIFSTFGEVKEFRDSLAHSIVDVSDPALERGIEEGIGFILWKDSKPISDIDFNDWELKSNQIYTMIREVKELLPYKEI